MVAAKHSAALLQPVADDAYAGGAPGADAEASFLQPTRMHKYRFSLSAKKGFASL